VRDALTPILVYRCLSRFGLCANDLDINSEACQDLRICVTQGTTTIQRLKEFFPERYIVESSSPSLTIEKFVKEDCNAIAGGFIDVTLANIQSFGYDGPYEIGPAAFSKEPLALVTREDDPLWSAFCYWVVSATLYAEERGITKQTYSKMPRVDLFGPLYLEMFRSSIQAMDYRERAQTC
jgi:hypothetical protein